MKNALKIKRLTFLMLLGVLLTSCLTNVEEEAVDQDPTVDPCEGITYSLKVKPIIDANCVQCHGAGGNFPNLTTYNGVNANAGIVKSEVVSRRMPQGGSLTSEEITAISCWVDAGALNN
jgi:hypothetical protein